MSKIMLCAICLVLLIVTAVPVLSFTVTISNYGAVYSGWEETWIYDEYGQSVRWYWSGTGVDSLDDWNDDWTTNRPNTLTCQITSGTSATITSSGAVPPASYLWLPGYRPHVIESHINYFEFEFDLTWSGTLSDGPWYLSVIDQPLYFGADDIRNATPYFTRQLTQFGIYHVSGNLNGSGAPVIVLSNIAPGASVPEPSSLIGILGGMSILARSAIRRRRQT